MNIIRHHQSDFLPQRDALRKTLSDAAMQSPADGSGPDVSRIVGEIIQDVRERGDEALVHWEAKLDGAKLTSETLRVSTGDIQAAHQRADEAFLALIRRAAENIRAYQEHIRIQPPDAMVRGGRRLGVRYNPIQNVGVYVPGGRAIYPSTVLMTVIPAQVAGVQRIALASPPTCDGDVSQTVLALAGELGISEVWRLGGAVAIAALAGGTETVPRVDMIVGPGNAFVAEAKRQVFGRVGIDSIAGPSEVLIVADETARPEWLAADLIAQSEHDPGSAILVTDSDALAVAVADQIDQQLPALKRADAARASLDRYGAILVVETLDAACAIANDFAPEHLQIVTRDDASTLAKIQNAGAIFLGPQTPVAVGDYYAGPSHVLPTGGTARFFGPLSVNDFLKSTSTLQYDSTALREDASDIRAFADREGLTAHGRTVELRESQ